jgi:DNA-binding NarL/FixJ family response regulator
VALTSSRPTDDVALAFARLGDATRQLHRCRASGELLALAASLIRQECGFSRAVILGVAGRVLNATDTDALADPASDRLRRAVLRRPVAFTAATAEERLITAAACGAAPDGTAPSVLAAQLGLRQYLLEPIVVQGAVVAMLVLDREIPDVRPAERALAGSYAAVVEVMLEQQLLQARVADVAAELRRMTTFSQALMNETLAGQLALPSSRPQATAWMSAPETAPAIRPDHVLTAQELKVAKLLAVGRSNREIAAELVLSVDTIKSHVARILQKLGVANRAQAAVVMVGQ